ncbi:hypothetical protein B1R94_24200 [Mycolicibacterium litorale]|nr:hypothetical protein B1R94_24200 [Mycolicibacterium litorale]
MPGDGDVAPDEDGAALCAPEVLDWVAGVEPPQAASTTPSTESDAIKDSCRIRQQSSAELATGRSY